MTEGRKWLKIKTTEGRLTEGRKFSIQIMFFLPSVIFYPQSFYVPSVVFYLWSFSTFSHSTFGHFLSSVFLPPVFLPSVILPSVFLLSVILRWVFLHAVTVSLWHPVTNLPEGCWYPLTSVMNLPEGSRQPLTHSQKGCPNYIQRSTLCAIPLKKVTV
jgi:hypothetical protein